MAPNQKITDDELSQIKNIQEKYAEITAVIGQLEVQKELLNREKLRLDNEIISQWSNYDTTQSTEQSISISLKEKYGEGSLDVTTGIFTPGLT